MTPRLVSTHAKLGVKLTGIDVVLRTVNTGTVSEGILWSSPPKPMKTCCSNSRPVTYNQHSVLLLSKGAFAPNPAVQQKHSIFHSLSVRRLRIAVLVSAANLAGHLDRTDFNSEI